MKPQKMTVIDDTGLPLEVQYQISRGVGVVPSAVSLAAANKDKLAEAHLQFYTEEWWTERPIRCLYSRV